MRKGRNAEATMSKSGGTDEPMRRECGCKGRGEAARASTHTHTHTPHTYSHTRREAHTHKPQLLPHFREPLEITPRTIEEVGEVLAAHVPPTPGLV